MDEERQLLPHQEAAILLEYARDGELTFSYRYIETCLQCLLLIFAGQDLNGSKLTLRSRMCY